MEAVGSYIVHYELELFIPLGIEGFSLDRAGFNQFRWYGSRIRCPSPFSRLSLVHFSTKRPSKLLEDPSLLVFQLKLCYYPFSFSDLVPGRFRIPLLIILSFLNRGQFPLARYDSHHCKRITEPVDIFRNQISSFQKLNIQKHDGWLYSQYQEASHPVYLIRVGLCHAGIMHLGISLKRCPDIFV